MVKYKVFYRLLFALAVMLLLISGVFTYMHKVSESEIRENLENATKKQLDFSIEQLEKDLKQLEKLNILLLNDMSIKSYATSADFSGYIDHLFQKKYLEEKLRIQQSANKFYNNITIYWPQNEEVISTSREKEFDSKYLIESPKNEWFLTNEDDQLTFHYLVSNPYFFQEDLQNVTTVIETTFTSDYLATTIETIDASETSKSFFIFQDSTIFANHSIEEGLISKLENETALANSTNPIILKLDHEKYSVQTSQSPLMNATLVSYIKLDDFLSPLTNVKRLAYISLILLFVSGIALGLLLYRDIHFNIRHLIEKIGRLGQGNYHARVTIKPNNEFNLLFNHFNSMAGQIQSLIENVYEEKIRVREAEYKHLQSQINPHFLYNSLFYIVTMAKRSPTAVISMADNLARYYRYITRKAGNETSLFDELNFVESYLKVHSLRNKRIQYTIDIPDELNDMIIPPLSIQPIVENTIIHGFDQKKDSGKITIYGEIVPNGCKVIIEDDGIGMSSQEIDQLTSRLDQRMGLEEMGQGLSNIHQRIVHKFGPNSGLKFSKSTLGGLCVTVYLMDIDKTEYPLNE